MNEETLIQSIVSDKIKELGGFLVTLKIHPNKKVLVEFDKPEGIKISDCAMLSKALNNDPALEKFFENHELEVSSPGMDNPFKVHEQYLKNIGKKVKVKIVDEEALTGTLLSVNEDSIEIQPIVEKKKPVLPNRLIPFTSIRETRKVITFN